MSPSFNLQGADLAVKFAAEKMDGSTLLLSASMSFFEEKGFPQTKKWLYLGRTSPTLPSFWPKNATDTVSKNHEDKNGCVPSSPTYYSMSKLVRCTSRTWRLGTSCKILCPEVPQGRVAEQRGRTDVGFRAGVQSGHDGATKS